MAISWHGPLLAPGTTKSAFAPNPVSVYIEVRRGSDDRTNTKESWLDDACMYINPTPEWDFVSHVIFAKPRLKIAGLNPGLD